MIEQHGDFVGKSMRDILRDGIQAQPDNLARVAYRAHLSRQLLSIKVMRGDDVESSLNTATVSRVLSAINADWKLEPIIGGYKITVIFK